MRCATASTSGVAEISESDVPLACAVTPSRSAPQRRGQRRRRLPRQRGQKRRRNASGRANRSPQNNPERESHREVLNQSAGLTRGWLAEEVENLSPSKIAPGDRRSPTIRPITKLTMNCPADLVKECGIPSHSHRSEKRLRVSFDIHTCKAQREDKMDPPINTTLQR